MYVFTFKQETYILVDIKKRHCGGTFKQVTKTIQILFPNIIFYYSSVFPFMGCALNPNMSKSVIFGIRKAIAACGQYSQNEQGQHAIYCLQSRIPTSELWWTLDIFGRLFH